MTKSLKNKVSIIVGTAMTIAVACTANADPARRPDTAVVQNQIAAAPATVTLPTVVVHPVPDQSWYYDPYTSGHGPRASSNSTIRVPRVPKPTPLSWYNDLYVGATNCPNGGTPGSVFKCVDLNPPSHPMR